jgi:hypothetical protein
MKNSLSDRRPLNCNALGKPPGHSALQVHKKSPLRFADLANNQRSPVSELALAGALAYSFRPLFRVEDCVTDTPLTVCPDGFHGPKVRRIRGGFQLVPSPTLPEVNPFGPHSAHDRGGVKRMVPSCCTLNLRLNKRFESQVKITVKSARKLTVCSLTLLGPTRAR